MAEALNNIKSFKTKSVPLTSFESLQDKVSARALTPNTKWDSTPRPEPSRHNVLSRIWVASFGFYLFLRQMYYRNSKQYWFTYCVMVKWWKMGLIFFKE